MPLGTAPSRAEPWNAPARPAAPPPPVGTAPGAPAGGAPEAGAPGAGRGACAAPAAGAAAPPGATPPPRARVVGSIGIGTFGGAAKKLPRSDGPTISYLRRSAARGHPRPTLLKPGSATCWAPAPAAAPIRDSPARTASRRMYFCISIPLKLHMHGPTTVGAAAWHDT